MIIRPSAAIRQNYNEIAEQCRQSSEPVFLTRHGEGDLVVMDINTWERREKMLDLRESLLKSEEERLRGEVYTVDEVVDHMESALTKTRNAATNGNV